MCAASRAAVPTGLGVLRADFLVHADSTWASPLALVRPLAACNAKPSASCLYG